MKNVFFFRHINSIGGIEAFFYYLAKKYKDWDITIYYMTGDINQIKRLKKYVRVKQYKKDEKIICDKAFFNFNLDIIDNVEAKEYIQIAHGDYKAMGIKPNTHQKITKYLGVSKQVCDTYKEVTGYDTELVYNPIEIDEPKKVLNLISATRLTAEKGKSRMIKLAEMLDEANIPYLWTIFTDDINAIKNPNIAYMKPRLDIINYIANADYLVQLSDNEGYCYSVVEALSAGTPVIVTDVPVFKEIGVEDNKNGFILDFDLSNFEPLKIYNSKLKFNYIQKEDKWSIILAKGESTYKEEKMMKAKVKCIKHGGYDDLELKRHIKENEIIEELLEIERAEYLKENNAVEILEIIKDENEKEENKKEIEKCLNIEEVHVKEDNGIAIIKKPVETKKNISGGNKRKRKEK